MKREKKTFYKFIHHSDYTLHGFIGPVLWPRISQSKMIHDEIFIRVENIFILLNMFALYGHTGQALLPKPFTQGPLISKIR